MPYLSDAYATLADMKGYLRINDTEDDAQITLALDAASRAIDSGSHRAFGLDDPAVPRYWTFEGIQAEWSVYDIADVATTTGLVVKADTNDDGVFDTTATAKQYQMLPTNAEADGRPYRSIAVHEDLAGPGNIFRVEVTAKFGWLTVPSPIKQACLIQAARILKRRESPFGVAGSPDLGSELRLLDKLDPDVAVLIQHYKRRWAAV